MLERTFGRGLSGSFEALFFPLIANRLNDLIDGEILLPFVAVAGVVAGAGAVQAEKAGETIRTQFAIMVSAPQSASSLFDQTIICGQKRIDVCRFCRCEMECIKWTKTCARRMATSSIFTEVVAKSTLTCDNAGSDRPNRFSK